MSGLGGGNKLPLAETTAPDHAQGDLDLNQLQGLLEETEAAQAMADARERGLEAAAEGGAPRDSSDHGLAPRAPVATNSYLAATRPEQSGKMLFLPSRAWSQPPPQW
jgi:hypothetical protein